MERVILRASEGMVFTDGCSGGRVVYLAEGQTAEGWQEVPEQALHDALERGVSMADAVEEDFRDALREFGVEV